jgi:hypothetical protein
MRIPLMCKDGRVNFGHYWRAVLLDWPADGGT